MLVRGMLGENSRFRSEDFIVLTPAPTVAHYRELTERTAGPVLKLVESLGTSDPGKLAAFRSIRRAYRPVLRPQHRAAGLSDDAGDQDLRLSFQFPAPGSQLQIPDPASRILIVRHA
jgi:hypothetical protein